MANPTVAGIQAFYADLAERCLDRWHRAVEDGRDGTYTADRFYSDTAAAWADLASLMAYPWSVLLPEPGPPRLSIPVRVAGNAVVRTKLIPKAPTGTTTPTDLVAADGTRIPQANVTTALNPNRTILTVGLQNLQSLPAGTLVEGRMFDGEVSVAGTVIAKIRVHVVA